MYWGEYNAVNQYLYLDFTIISFEMIIPFTIIPFAGFFGSPTLLKAVFFPTSDYVAQGSFVLRKMAPIPLESPHV